MSEDVLVRLGRAADLEDVLALWRRADSEPTATDDVEALQRLLARDPGALLVASAGERVVGSLVAGFDGWRGSMYRLAVDPGWRRLGVGLALVRAAEARFAALGVRRLDAIVVSDRADALGFWAAAGYSRQSARARFVRTLPLGAQPPGGLGSGRG